MKEALLVAVLLATALLSHPSAPAAQAQPAALATQAPPAALAAQALPPAAAIARPDTTERSGAIEGRVVDADGRPLRTVLAQARPTFGGTEARRRDGVGGTRWRGATRSAETDEAGYFRIEELTEGAWILELHRLGYGTVQRAFEVRDGESTRLDVAMDAAVLEVAGIAVGGRRSRNRARFEDDAGTTSREISGEAIRLLPGFMEGDPLRAVEILPGVVSPTDFSASYNVRGGSSDQNLILLDGFPLFSPFHLGGVFSVFNADLIERVELQSGGFSAEDGGRVSSVLRIETDPGPGELQVDAGLSLLAGRAAVAGGLGEGINRRLGLESGRWRISARRSHVDRLLEPVADLPYVVRDVQAHFEGWTPGRDRLTLTGYTGRDVLDLERVSTETFPLRLHWSWGNDLAGVRWMRTSDDGGRVELAAGGSRFDTQLRFTDFEDSEFASEVEQLLARGSIQRYMRGGWTAGGGLDLDRYRYANHARSGGTSLGAGSGAGTGGAPWAELGWKRRGAWIVEGGIRLESWFPDHGQPLWIPSPRLSVKRFVMGGEGAVRASVGRYAQFAQSVRDEELPLGIDVWVTADDETPHLVSDQVQVGAERFFGGGWFAALDGYYRTFDGVIATNPARDPNRAGNELLDGHGRSYGADLFVERAEGDVTGSLSLSWLRAERTFPDVLAGGTAAADVSYPPPFDRRLDLDVVVRAPLPGRWQASLRWHVGSGLPYTRPAAHFAHFEPRQTQDGRLRWQGAAPEARAEGEERRPYAIAMGERNGARYPAYHRLDLSIRGTFRPHWGRITPYLDLLNVYNQPNVLFYHYDFESDPPTRSGLSMFPVLPSVGVEVSF